MGTERIMSGDIRIRDCFNVINVIIDFIGPTNLRTTFTQCTIRSTNHPKKAYKTTEKMQIMTFFSEDESIILFHNKNYTCSLNPSVQLNRFIDYNL